MDIPKRPYWEQVVEQQFEYNRILNEDLKKSCPDNFTMLWYEDICNNTAAVLADLHKTFASWGWNLKMKSNHIPKLKISSGHPEMKEDIDKIEAYVNKNHLRLQTYKYTGPINR